jgi:hypothetical protein
MMVYLLRTGPRHNGVADGMTLVPVTPDVVRVVKEKHAKPKRKTYGSSAQYQRMTDEQKRDYCKRVYQARRARRAAQRQNETTV